MSAKIGKLGSSPHDHGRAAFTLVEMVVVVALSAVLLGIVISLAQSLMRWDQLSHTRGVRGEQLAELAELLRTDVRHGTDLLIVAGGPLVVTSSAGKQIRYDLEKEGCRRTIVSDGTAESRTDLLTIGEAQTWTIEKTVTGRRPLILITLERVAIADPPTAPTPFLVQAELGADLVRLEQPSAVPNQQSDPTDVK
jgi:prepilin-type N-terminal cleavage/methylation domain-containing protein